MDDDFVKKRLERDLADLKRMCDDHFKKRAEDDSHITDLEGRISKRQESREKQKQERIEKEQVKVSQESDQRYQKRPVKWQRPNFEPWSVH